MGGLPGDGEFVDLRMFAKRAEFPEALQKTSVNRYIWENFAGHGKSPSSTSPQRHWDRGRGEPHSDMGVA